VVGLWTADPALRQAVPEALSPSIAVVPLSPKAVSTMWPDHLQAILLDAALLERPDMHALWHQEGQPPVLVMLRPEQLGGDGPLPRVGRDFVVWPCLPGELRLRVQALLAEARRRSRLIRCGPISIDPERLEVRVAERPVHLTPKEFCVLQELAQRCNCPVHRQDLLNAGWGWETESSSNVVDAVVRNLRQKLEPTPARPRYILTVRGVGYKLVSGETGPEAWNRREA
jgi:DNA-binding response OmpR family regulator